MSFPCSLSLGESSIMEGRQVLQRNPPGLYLITRSASLRSGAASASPGPSAAAAAAPGPGAEILILGPQACQVALLHKSS